MTKEERVLYREALANARSSFDVSAAKLKESREEQVRLEQEIANLRKTITALAALCSEEPGIDKLGITEAVMEAMTATSFSWTTGEVVHTLDAMGFDLATQKNAQASVHAVLTRLAQQGKITRVKDAKKNENGNPWEWRGPHYDAAEDAAVGFCYKPGERPVTDDDVPF